MGAVDLTNFKLLGAMVFHGFDIFGGIWNSLDAPKNRSLGITWNCEGGGRAASSNPELLKSEFSEGKGLA